ncbi:unnamed protein product [Rhizoctonia solani]|uniref:Uncharacterized protein n=1 Tax=Rhizoctonia solani TaxID=456999 RepID=A0A8H2WMQ2_9AGAM|nr:unnamed protein product [Rhizoctonia solani]
MQVVSLAPWGSYAEYVHDVFQRRAYDSKWNLHQAHPQVDPTEAHNTIQEVLWELESRVDAFHFPNYLDFLQTPVDGQIPQLADTKRNMAVNEHHNKLEELLSKLRGVKARGDEAVRRLRTDAIAQVEEELEELKRQKALVWYNMQADSQHRRRFWTIW